MPHVDMHVHTLYSRGDGLASPEEVIHAAERRGLCGVAITDHDTMDGYRAACAIPTSLALIPGCEVSSADGHILSYFVSSPVPPGLSADETIRAIRAQGGLAVASHPLDRRRHGVGERAFSLPFDAIEVRNGHNVSTNAETERRARLAGIPCIGGTDAHLAREVGSVTTVFPTCGGFADHIRAGRTDVHGAPVSRLTLVEKALRTHLLRQSWRA
jgi:predicted metal-dependent phosphoesterase TrpH